MDTSSIIMSQGPSPPNPLMAERFQSVVSSLFQLVCSTSSAVFELVWLVTLASSLKQAAYRKILKLIFYGTTKEFLRLPGCVRTIHQSKPVQYSVRKPQTEVARSVCREFLQVSDAVEDSTANFIVAQLLYLDWRVPNHEQFSRAHHNKSLLCRESCRWAALWTMTWRTLWPCSSFT